MALAYTNMSAQGVGAPIEGVAHNTGNLWITYQVAGSSRQHGSIGIGVNARSATIDVDSDTGSYYRNPGNASTDLHFGYTLDGLSINLGIRDLFDRRIYDRYQLYPTYIVLDTVGRSLLLSGKYQFQ